MEEMKCCKCDGKEYYQSLCRSCFKDIITRKVRKEIRLHSPLKKNEVLLVKDEIARHFLEQISMPIKIVKKGKHDREVIPWTMDDEDEEFLECMFTGKKQKDKKSHIKLFRLITEQELDMYARLIKIKYTIPKQSDMKIHLNTLTKRYPQTKHSLLRSSLEMRKINIEDR